MADPIYILDPRADTRPVEERALPTLDALDGRTVAILNNGWTSMDRLAQSLERELRARGAADVLHVRIPITSAAEPALLDRVVGEADCAIVGLAN